MSGNVSSRIPVCCFLSLTSPLFLISSYQERAEWHAAPRTEIKRWNACIGCPSLAFPYGESDYSQPSFGFMASITPASLLTCKVWSFDLYLKKLPCNTVYVLTQSSIKHPCSTRDLGPRVLLSLSLSLSLSLFLADSLERGNLLSWFSCPGFQDLFKRTPCAYVSGTSLDLGLHWFSVWPREY